MSEFCAGILNFMSNYSRIESLGPPLKWQYPPQGPGFTSSYIPGSNQEE